MKRFGSLISIFAVAMLLSACVTDGNGTNTGNKSLIGTLLGAGAGGFAGAQVGGGKGKLAATAIGVLAGAWLGNSIGTSLDKVDRITAQRNTQTALERTPVNKTTSWSNPDNRTYGTTTPTRTYKSNRRNCRDYTDTVTMGGRTETVHGTACRDSQGRWVISNRQQSSYSKSQYQPRYMSTNYRY